MAADLVIGANYSVKGWRGVAFYLDSFSEEDGSPVVVMVGDNKKHSVDVDDLTPLPEEEFCSECGQIGCGHGR